MIDGQTRGLVGLVSTNRKIFFGFVDLVISASGSRGSHICVISGVWMSWERSDRAESLFFLCKAAQCIVCKDGQGLGGSALPYGRALGVFWWWSQS